MTATMFLGLSAFSAIGPLAVVLTIVGCTYRSRRLCRWHTQVIVQWHDIDDVDALLNAVMRKRKWKDVRSAYKALWAMRSARIWGHRNDEARAEFQLSQALDALAGSRVDWAKVPKHLREALAR